MFSLNVHRLRDIHCTLVLLAESPISFLHAPLSMSIHNPSSDIAQFCITGSKAWLVEFFKPMQSYTKELPRMLVSVASSGLCYYMLYRLSNHCNFVVMFMLMNNVCVQGFNFI